MSDVPYTVHYDFLLTDEPLTDSYKRNAILETHWFDSKLMALIDERTSVTHVTFHGERRVERIIVTYERDGGVRRRVFDRDTLLGLERLP